MAISVVLCDVLIALSSFAPLSHVFVQVVVEEGSMENFLDKEDDEFLAKKPGRKV